MKRVLVWGLWLLLGAMIAVGMLTFRSSSPVVLSYSGAHLAFIVLATVAFSTGTRAIFGSPARAWDIAFVSFSTVSAGLFAAKNFVTRHELSLVDFMLLVLAAVSFLWLRRTAIIETLNLSFRRAAVVIAINGLVLVCLLLTTEVFARLFLANFDPERAINTQYGNPFWFQFQPFLMFSMDRDVNITFKNARLPGDQELGTLKTNNMGFRMEEPVKFDKLRKKQPGERVVLFTGGSTAWGAGATANEKTIPARLEQILNKSQKKYRYVVFSFSSGGWIAMQSVLALIIYGPNFDPDWVVSMDGNNDIVEACAEGYGAGRDRYSSVFDQYFRSYLYHQSAPPFYRGALENYLVGASLLYRLLTDKKYIPAPKQYSADWGAVEGALSFYSTAYERLFAFLSASRVKMLLSSQPYKNLYKNDFEVSSAQLDAIAERFRNVPCETVPHLELMRYFHPRLRSVSESLVAHWKDRLDVRYLDINALMPQDPAVRLRYSWGNSPVHLSDEGQDYVANIFADAILAADSNSSSVDK